MTQSDPTGMHEWHSGEYVQEWIGSYTSDERKEALRRIPRLVLHDPDEPIRVLDICGGWGPVTEVVLEAFPKAKVVLHDFSEPMLDQARGHLAEYLDQVSFHRCDLMSSDWAKGLGGQFDAVVSSLGIHNVRFPDRIKAIYEEIFPLVAPGGCFVNLDQVASGDLAGDATRHTQQMVAREQIHRETSQWKPLSEVAATVGNRGERMHRHARASEADLQRIQSHEPATLVNTLRWLLDAGFDDVDCFARDRGSALIGAFRAK